MTVRAARCWARGSRIGSSSARRDRIAPMRAAALEGSAEPHRPTAFAFSSTLDIQSCNDRCVRPLCGPRGAALDHLIVRHTHAHARARRNLSPRTPVRRLHPTSHHTRCMHRPPCATCRTRSRSLGFCLAVEMPRVRPACALFKLCAQHPHSLTRRSAHSAGWLVGDACAALCHMAAHVHTCCPLPSRLLVSRPRVSLQCALRA